MDLGAPVKLSVGGILIAALETIWGGMTHTHSHRTWEAEAGESPQH